MTKILLGNDLGAPSNGPGSRPVSIFDRSHDGPSVVCSACHYSLSQFSVSPAVNSKPHRRLPHPFAGAQDDHGGGGNSIRRLASLDDPCDDSGDPCVLARSVLASKENTRSSSGAAHRSSSLARPART